MESNKQCLVVEAINAGRSSIVHSDNLFSDQKLCSSMYFINPFKEWSTRRVQSFLTINPEDSK
jgi:hypothetical protein